MNYRPLVLCIITSSLICEVLGECPWPRTEPTLNPLNSACLCATNHQGEWSVQCSAVDFPLLMGTLHGGARPGSKGPTINLLYVNNSDINVIRDRTFFGLRIRNLQLSFSRIANISQRAFEGLENSLQNLNLQNNLLAELPTRTFALLQSLHMLDLSNNKLTRIPDRSFSGLHVTTLKLSGNAVVLTVGAFIGLEESLKNLNLKSCRLKRVPVAVKALKGLAFLDLAQNEISDLDEGTLSSLDSLTALNLERNQLQHLSPQVFSGVSDSLSSLSLLNNLLSKFPMRAVNSLPHLRVFDIGFNLITRLPEDAFRNVRALTLLAVDGNPLPFLPEVAFQHLNGSLRGLSLGGEYFHCDCRTSWIVKWIEEFELQVTSRHQNPTYCGHPKSLQNVQFYDLKEETLVCEEPSTTTTTTTTMGTIRKKPKVPQPLPMKPKLSNDEENTLEDRRREGNPREGEVKEVQSPTTLGPKRRYPPKNIPRRPVERPTGVAEPPEAKDEVYHKGEVTLDPIDKPPSRDLAAHEANQRNKIAIDKEDKKSEGHQEDSSSSGERRIYSQNRGQVMKSRRPPIVRRPQEIGKTPHEFYSASSTENKKHLYGEEVIVQDVYWDLDSINIQWDSEVSNILGFRVVYRLFGDKYFKMGQPLSPSAREFKIKNVPANEYFVACVVSLEEMDIKLESVPFGQCREIRTGEANGKLSTHMDKIIIGASASICGTVIIAVIIFICCYRGKGKPQNEKQNLPTSMLNPSSPPLASLGALGANTKADWDNISMYSQRSIPRARMYHQSDKDETRSHVSQMSSKSRPRSLADGQSQRSFSGMSGVHMPPSHFQSPLSLSRPELRLSRQSLAHSQFGSAQFGSGYPHFANPGMISRATSQRSERRRSTRSKSRERTSSRLSHAGSSHSLTGYDTDGWTDHDMDIYMARNATRGGLVQL